MYEEAKNFISPQRKKWHKYYDAYRSYRQTGKDPWKANLFIPYTFSTIEQLLPALVLAKKTFTAIPTKELFVDTAEKNSKLLQYQWKRAKMDLRCINWLKSALIYGLGVGKCTWDLKYNKRGQVIYDDPAFHNVDIFDFFPDPSSIELDLSDADYAMHRRFMSKKELEEAGFDVSLIHGDSSEVPQEKRQRYTTEGLQPQVQKGKIEILEIWIKDDRVVTLALDGGSQLILGEKDYPFQHGELPFVLATDYPDLHSLYGIGEPETIYSLQVELNALRSQRMDNMNLILNRMYQLRKGSGVDPKQAISRPGGIIWVSEIDRDIKPFDMSDIPMSTYREEGELKSDINTTTSVGSYGRGAGAGGSTPETASAVNTMGEATSSRNMLKANLFEWTGLKRLGEMFYALDQEFVDQEKMIRVIGDEGAEFVNILPEDVLNHYDIEVSISPPPPENLALAKSQMLELYSLMREDPQVDQIKLKKIVLDSFNVPSLDGLVQEPVMTLPNGMPVPGAEAGLPAEGGMPQGGSVQPPPSPPQQAPTISRGGRPNPGKKLLQSVFGGRRIPSGRTGIKGVR